MKQQYPKDVLIVFTPQMFWLYPNKRFLVSPRQLHHYVGTENANKAITAAIKTQTNKHTLKFRKFGKLDIYLK